MKQITLYMYQSINRCRARAGKQVEEACRHFLA